MKVEIVSVGTELLMGEIVNTNAKDLMKFCKDIGFDVYYETTVGDNPQRLKQVLTSAFERGADMVITSGGIGPTNDDLTKEISAAVFGLEIVYLEAEANKIATKVGFLNRGQKHIAKSNFKQAYYVKGAYILENEVGTANGCIIEKNGKRIVNLPGPPIELRYVIEHSLKPYMTSLIKEHLYTREYVVWQSGESQLADELETLLQSQNQVTLALYAGQGFVRLRLATKQVDETKAIHLLDTWEKALAEILQTRLLPIEALKHIEIKHLPPFRLELNHCEFLQPFFKQACLKSKIVEDSPHQVSIALRQEKVGEVLVIDAYFMQQHFTKEIPCLKKVLLNIEKVQQKLYAFLEDISLEVMRHDKD